MKRSKYLVTGAAGFIGSTAIENFLKQGHSVVGIDNLKTGRLDFLTASINHKNFTFIELDLNEADKLQTFFKGVDFVFHFAANADVRFGPEHPRLDLEQNVIVTHNVLEACRIAGVKKFAFSSTGSIYGESNVIPTPESAPFPVQTSLYGASKLAAEGLIQAYAESFGIKSWIFRFVSILGPRYTHGHIFDFFKQLQIHPELLTVLGNGKQNKSYLHVFDCIAAIDIAIIRANEKINIFNLGLADSCEIRDSVAWILDELNLSPKVEYGSEPKGWIGDNPLIRLDTTRIESLGWKPRFSIQESVRETVRYLQRSPELLR